ncbi:hypothetical protein POM88_001329 [Heracleum sosnowskyi]|uniref:NAC domain-containing protein n=1 Tax=Heracleum sosnowskyi TaxID=360622 RepID=A0AAD8JCS9_9APIA|nr:hypothetical protein POM88_001329 [Heracleum sosnowskyi]
MFSSIGLHHAVILNETSLRKVYSGCCLIINEFIPTLDTENGIYYTHPENLPGAQEDGTSVYFFQKTANAYATGQRKRQKIQNKNSSGKEHVRWHKTGKTKPVLENGTEKGITVTKSFNPDNPCARTDLQECEGPCFCHAYQQPRFKMEHIYQENNSTYPLWTPFLASDMALTVSRVRCMWCASESWENTAKGERRKVTGNTLNGQSLTQLQLTLWGGMATIFTVYLELHRQKNIVLVITGLLVKKRRGNICLSPTLATSVHFNPRSGSTHNLGNHIAEKFGELYAMFPV